MRTMVVPLLVGLAVSFITGCEHKPQEASAATSRSKVEPSPQDRPTLDQPSRLTAAIQGRQPGEFTTLAAPKREPRSLELVSIAVETSPKIDGVADDEAWKSASEIATLDRSSQQELRIKSVHTGDEIFMLVSYDDAAASIEHKPWIWDKSESVYKAGPEREDAFVFKWSMSGNDAQLSLFNNPQPHKADIWFWKACRTNPMGYADDKTQTLSTASNNSSNEDDRRIDLADGNVLYLHRNGDAGKAAYVPKMVFDYEGDKLNSFASCQPEGSRADVRAKGRWSDGIWTIEFARKLDTGHDDDVTFTIGGSYLFGATRYEMAHDPPNPEHTQPLYRTGDVFDRLLLTIAR